VVTVLKAQAAPKEDKGMWMHRHKSLGLLTGMLVAPRVVYRLLSRSSYNVEHLQGSAAWEVFAGKAGHYLLYGFITVMPASGIVMGYYGGKGLPFFATTIPGVVTTPENKKSNGEIAKQSYNIHKTVGTYGKFLIPLHVGASFSHYFRGQAIFARMNPFAKPRA
jgi:cytochrome b561